MSETLLDTPQRLPAFASIQEEISSMLSVPDGELSPEQRQLMDAYLNSLGVQEARKIDNFCQFLRLEKARIESLKAESQRLASMARTAEKRIAYLKSRYLSIMQEHGIHDKIRGDVYTLSIRSTPVVAVENPELVPDEFWNVKEERNVDKVMVKNCLKAGKPVPGCRLQNSFILQAR